MTDPIHLGILGCGRIVQQRMLPALATQDAAVVHAIASERLGVADKVAGEHQIPHVYNSYEDILADPHVEAVYIPCIGSLHHRWTVAAAAAGKHILCEKPLAPTYEEAENMVVACQHNGVLLQEAFMWRHHPRPQRVKQLIEEGAIGNLRIININFSFDIDRSDWRLHPEHGGGVMWDLGSYGVNCCRFITDAEPIDIVAAARWWETGVDMSMRIGLTFPGDILANIDCSFEGPYRCRVEFFGDGGRIVLEKAFQPFLETAVQIWRSTDRAATPETFHVDGPNQYAAQVVSFCEGIRAGELQPPAENGLHNMHVLSEILDYARTH